MSAGLILFVGAIYLAVMAGFVGEHRPGMALAFFGYALSNVGLWMDAKGITWPW